MTLHTRRQDCSVSSREVPGTETGEEEMRKNVKRGLAAGALVLAMGLPIGAYAADDDTTTWTPGDCDMPAEVRAAFESPELQALREARQAEATQLRAEHRTAQDPDTRDARQAEAAKYREQYREQVEAQLAANPEALAWFQENGAGQNARQGEGAGAGAQAGQRAGGQARQGDRVQAQDCLTD